MHVFPCDSLADVENKWYKNEDKRRFTSNMIQDARRTKVRMTEVPLPQGEEIYACVGLEATLSRDVFKLTLQHRRDHKRAILQTQVSLRSAGVVVSRSHRAAEGLARLSERSSTWARDRAASIAAGYWELEEKK